MTQLPACPDCGDRAPSCLGALPDVPYFAGRIQPGALPGGRLMWCRNCDLRFRWPLLTDYRALYDNSSVEAWTSGALRHDQRLVSARLEQRPGAGTLLDFGCYSGGLLAQLPARFQKFGVEVSTAAASMASTRSGATVVPSIGDLPTGLQFDVIVAMDVIEHVPSPRALLEQLISRLAPGGWLLLTTGDGGNRLWRMVGSRWWYCYYPEHISFISEPWLRLHAARLGFTIQRIDRFCYLGEAREGSKNRWLDWIKYLLRPARHAGKRARHLERHGSDMGVPGMGLTRDHLLVQLTR